MSVLHITKENFQKEIMESQKPVLVDFFADWCGPCKMVSPILDEIAKEQDGVKIGKINVDEEGELAMSFQVMSIPTLMVFQDGKIVQKALGAQSKQAILSMLP